VWVGETFHSGPPLLSTELENIVKKLKPKPMMIMQKQHSSKNNKTTTTISVVELDDFIDDPFCNKPNDNP
jgi:hypothetical protein